MILHDQKYHIGDDISRNMPYTIICVVITGFINLYILS
nr:MAG TPA: hypothetical protein [Caudoviricetes sp.]